LPQRLASPRSSEKPRSCAISWHSTRIDECHARCALQRVLRKHGVAHAPCRRCRPPFSRSLPRMATVARLTMRSLTWPAVEAWT
jgi:hypothetical protein